MLLRNQVLGRNRGQATHLGESGLGGTMSETEAETLMQNMAIFGAVSPEALRYIIDHAKSRHFSARQRLFSEGDLSNTMYVLIHGRVAIYRDWGGQPFKLREMQGGESIGEMSLLACSTRSASAVALDDSHAIEISNNLLADLYLQYPEQYTIFIMNMAREVCRRLVSADNRLFALERAGQGLRDHESVSAPCSEAIN